MPKEIKRAKLSDVENIPCPYQTVPVTECSGCKELDLKLTNLQDTVDHLNEAILYPMSTQNTAVMTALADLKVAMSKLVRQDATCSSIKSSFP